MIKIYALNVSEEILNKFKDFEVRAYYDNFNTLPIVYIVEDEELKFVINEADYGRINACILELRRREKGT